MFRSRLMVLVTLVVFTACGGPEILREELVQKGDKAWYQGHLYTGTVVDYYPNDKLRSAAVYQDGVLQPEQERVWKEDGGEYPHNEAVAWGYRARARDRYLKILETEDEHQRHIMAGEILELYRKALSYNPADAAAYNNMGTIFFDLMHDVRSAGNCFEKALKYRDRYPEAYLNLGLCYVSMRKDSLAAACMRKAIDQDPSITQAWRELSAAYLRLGLRDSVKTFCDRAIHRFPDKAAFYMDGGNARFIGGDTAGSLKYFEQAWPLLEPAAQAALAGDLSTLYAIAGDSARSGYYRERSKLIGQQ